MYMGPSGITSETWNLSVDKQLWFVRDGRIVCITVSATSLTDDKLIRVAESLQPLRSLRMP